MVKCDVENCKTMAKYGLKQEFATRCKKHVEKDMVHNSRTYCSHGTPHNKCEDCKSDLVCSIDDCKEKSIYGVKQRFATRCKNEKHRENGMVKQSRQYCEHDIQRRKCKKCKGSSICEHEIQRSHCKDCKGSQICDHGRQRYTCKDCEGEGICDHEIQRANCKICKGSQICDHGRQRYTCKDCEGEGICDHGRQRSQCKDCDGSQICDHGINRYYCKDCGGAGICNHGIQRSQCYRCTPESNYFCQRRYDNGIRCTTAKMKKNKYADYCTSCFVELFPNDPKTAEARLPNKEIAARREVESEFPGRFIFGKRLIIPNRDKKSSPDNYYPDMQAHFEICVFIIEIDENQHKAYDMEGEKIRIVEIYKAAGKNIVLLRFNPDKYIENREIKNPEIAFQHQVLIDKIREVIDKIESGYVFTEWLTEYKLFFDDDSKPEDNNSIFCSGFAAGAKRKCRNKVTKEGMFCNKHKSQSKSSLV